MGFLKLRSAYKVYVNEIHDDVLGLVGLFSMTDVGQGAVWVSFPDSKQALVDRWNNASLFGPFPNNPASYGAMISITPYAPDDFANGCPDYSDFADERALKNGLTGATKPGGFSISFLSYLTQVYQNLLNQGRFADSNRVLVILKQYKAGTLTQPEAQQKLNDLHL